MGFLDTSEFDFETYKNNLKTYLKGQDIFKDYDFDGSEIDTLLSLLSYNTYNSAFLVNMLGSEAFPDTASIREVVVSHAKSFNYLPRSRTASKALVNLTIVNPINLPSTIAVPKYYPFSATNGNTSVLFTTSEPLVIRNDGGNYTAYNVEIAEGRIVTEYFDVTSADVETKYPLASENIDISSLEVYVYPDKNNSANTKYTRSYNLFGLDGDSTTYFVEGYASTQYQIQFGNGVTGKQLSVGNFIKVVYRECSGAENNGITKFTKILDITAPSGDVYNNIKVQTVEASSGGVERESVSSIKFNYPRSYSAQNRGVNAGDIEYLIKSQYPQIQSISVFGGEELAQKQYGRTVISAKQFGSENISTTLKNSITEFLKDKTTFNQIVFVQPEYFYLGIDTLVSYDKSVTSLSTQIENNVRDVISNFASQNLLNFNYDFRYSKFLNAIDNADASIVSNETTCTLIKRIVPSKDAAFTNVIKWNNAFATPIVSPSFTSSFFIQVLDGVQYSVQLVDDLAGKIDVVYYKNNNKIVLQKSVGSIDYATGIVVLNGVSIYDYTSYISLLGTMKNKDIIISNNQILDIDQSDVNITFKKADY